MELYKIMKKNKKQIHQNNKLNYMFYKNNMINMEKIYI